MRRAPPTLPIVLVVFALGWASVGIAQGQLSDRIDLRGDVTLVGGVVVIDDERLPEPSTSRPTTLVLRLDATVDVAPRADLRAVIASSVGAGRPGESLDTVAASLGVQDLYLRVDVDASHLEASLGLRRWPLGELRLQPAMRLGRADRFGTQLGLLGGQAAVFVHPWRVRLGVAAPVDATLRPHGLGVVAAVRWDVASWTLEAHALHVGRSGGGVSASGTVGDQVVYGEAWLLGDPLEVRGGAGVAGYVADLLVTAEGAWAPADGDIDGAARPSVRLAVQAAPTRDLSIDASAGLAWPDDPRSPGSRTARGDAAVSLSLATSDAVLSLTPNVRFGGGTTVVGSTLTLRSFF